MKPYDDPVTGEHVTMYGNRYAQSEWNAMRQMYASRDKLTEWSRAQFAALKASFIAAIEAAGMQPLDAQRFFRMVADCDEWEERVVFTTPERKEAVVKAITEYDEALDALMKKESDFLAEIDERLSAALGYE